MQKKNRRIRGAGAAPKEPVVAGALEGMAKGAVGATAGNGVAALGSIIISQLSTMNRKLDCLSPGKRPGQR
ncbi:MAG: hypothetical protein JWM59_3464 [Verrucomicrobiales bacterium]|nr:hypothetical protein [Verrucomicrobiales bacterium]